MKIKKKSIKEQKEVKKITEQNIREREKREGKNVISF